MFMWYILGAFRERRLAIAFRASCCSLKALQQMGDSLSHSNMERSYLATLFNLSLFDIPMYTLTNHGKFSLQMHIVLLFPFALFSFMIVVVFQGKHIAHKAYVQDVHPVSQFHGGLHFLHNSA